MTNITTKSLAIAIIMLLASSLCLVAFAAHVDSTGKPAETQTNELSSGGAEASDGGGKQKVPVFKSLPKEILPPLTIYTTDSAPLTPKVETLQKKSQLSQYGLTWTFEKEVPVRQFVNGDWYVVGPVNVVMIDPKPLWDDEIKEGFINKDEVREDRYPGRQARNGSMLNPSQHGSWLASIEQGGFDSRIPSIRYKPELFTHLPIAMQPGDVLVSTISRRNDEITIFGGQHVNAVRACAVLSCLAEPQPADAFRVSYTDSSHSKIYLTRNLRRNLLHKLPRVEGVPDTLGRYAAYFQRPWEDICDFGFSAPLENMPHYGQTMVEMEGEAGLLLNMDYSPEEKERLLVNIVQVGIDFWGLTRAGRAWYAMGGLNSGRKWPIVFAGVMLGEEEMASPKKTFPNSWYQEDEQTEFCPCVYNGVTYDHCWTGAKVFFTGHSGWKDDGHPKGDRGGWSSGAGPLELFHPKDWPRPDHPVLSSEGYRRANTSCSWIGESLTMRMMHMEKIWDHDAFFAYVDRWMTEDDTEQVRIAKENGRKDWTSLKFGDLFRQGHVDGPEWVKKTWNQYREDLPPGPNGETTPSAETTWK